jgi:hypothetical protein
MKSEAKNEEGETRESTSDEDEVMTDARAKKRQSNAQGITPKLQAA